MAAELEKFIDRQLGRLKEDHPDRKFIIQIKDQIQNYSEVKSREQQEQRLARTERVYAGRQEEIEREARERVYTEEERRRIIDLTFSMVSSAFVVTKEEILGVSRFKSIVLARKAISHILFNTTDLSITGISKEMGYKDHTTVVHHLTTTDNLIIEDEGFGEAVLSIMNKITEENGGQNGNGESHPVLS